MKIGKINIPDITIPPEVHAELAAYMAKSGDSIGYISECGAWPEDDEPLKVDEAWVNLLASIKYFESGPDNGLAARNISRWMWNLNYREEALLVLHALADAGCLNLYQDSTRDNPTFTAGCCLMAMERYDEALEHFRRVEDVVTEKDQVWKNMGIAYHLMKKFDEASSYYSKGLHVGTLDERERDSFLNLIDDARNQRPFKKS